MVYTYLSYTAMGIGFIITAVYFYFFLIIMKKARAARRQGVEVASFVAIALMFLFFALVRLFLNYNEFHLFEYGTEEIVAYKLAALFGYLFFISFIFFTEKILKKTKYVITIFCSALCTYGIFFTKGIESLRI